ncbi:uncharacterized protein A4U43_C07F3000 [Asparagus officinalis]|uniref:Uncharacterized protein n=1 Tax=Asparagus officinalis TaxID=4686 RepID=A0A5P1E927_ASPOF|nr:uncharacterized protein A4U43_C07F3000 [Asparagus officinalis]
MRRVVDINLQALAFSSGDAPRMEEHRFAGRRLEESGIEVGDAGVEAIEGAEGGLVVEEADDGGHGESEEAEEDVDEAVVGLGEDYAVADPLDDIINNIMDAFKFSEEEEDSYFTQTPEECVGLELLLIINGGEATASLTRNKEEDPEREDLEMKKKSLEINKTTNYASVLTWRETILFTMNCLREAQVEMKKKVERKSIDFISLDRRLTESLMMLNRFLMEEEITEDDGGYLTVQSSHRRLRNSLGESSSPSTTGENSEELSEEESKEEEDEKDEEDIDSFFCASS